MIAQEEVPGTPLVEARKSPVEASSRSVADPEVLAMRSHGLVGQILSYRDNHEDREDHGGRGDRGDHEDHE